MDDRTPTDGDHRPGEAAGAATADRPSHYRPRTREGWIAVALFVALMALVQPPVVHSLADRTEPWILGLPFLYVYLLAVYSALIGVLLWAMKKGL